MPILTDSTSVGSTCVCSQAEVAATCELTEGAGILLSGTSPTIIETISSGSWSSYTPILENFSLGNGNNSSAYLLDGKTLDVIILMQFGSTSTFDASPFRVGFPVGVTPYIDDNGILAGHGLWLASFFDSSSGLYWQGRACVKSQTNPIEFRFGGGTTGSTSLVGPTVPFTWATSDQLTARLRLEVV